MTRAKLLIVSIFIGALLKMSTPSAMACAACFGASDSAMAKGMNWGIFSLLAVIVCMLSGIAGFFVFLAKKSAQVASAAPSEQPPSETKND
ncbi:MAG: hypothetical protein ABIP71_05785 [Verrucomicrobiota bacterium]